MNFTYSRFTRGYFSTYLKWFENELVKNALYGIDEEWLEYVLNDETGIEYAVFSEQEMLAVLGVKYPDADNPTYVITNIVVNPSVFGQGIGSLVLEDLNQLFVLEKGERWVAFVEPKNKIAQMFFAKNGWELWNGTSKVDQMLEFRKEGNFK
ncbi:MAG: GNAT family N-acetyltransferase [Saprospiraceae bacterium]|nr:GNAT family N-acetyltransferase [Saprospiraceae bacterium]